MRYSVAKTSYLRHNLRIINTQYHAKKYGKIFIFFNCALLIIGVDKGILPLGCLSVAAILYYFLQVPRFWICRGMAALILLQSFFFIQIGLIHFEFPNQALILYQSNPNVLFWLLSGNLHALRLLASYPSCVLSLLFEIEMNLAFTYYSVLLFFVFYICVLQSVYDITRQKPLLSSIAAYILLTALSFVMHGRLACSFCGLALILTSFSNMTRNRKLKSSHAFSLVIGLILTSVSSGTMLFTFLFVIFTLVKNFRHYIRINLWTIFLAASCLCFVVPMLYDLAIKAVRYFGGGTAGVFLMLFNHGIISKIKSISLLFWLLACPIMPVLLFILFKTIYFLCANNVQMCNSYLYVSGIVITCLGFFFGISSGIIFLVPLTMYISYKAGEFIKIKWN